MERRPIHLNFLTIRFPIPAIVSILHRASGVVLFFLIPVLLWALQTSLSSETHFELLKVKLTYSSMKFTFFILLSALIYHLLAGIRHLLMDVHIADTKALGRLGGFLVMILSFLSIMGLGWWLW